MKDTAIEKITDRMGMLVINVANCSFSGLFE